MNYATRQSCGLNSEEKIVCGLEKDSVQTQRNLDGICPNCELRIANCELRIANCELRILYRDLIHVKPPCEKIRIFSRRISRRFKHYLILARLSQFVKFFKEMLYLILSAKCRSPTRGKRLQIPRRQALCRKKIQSRRRRLRPPSFRARALAIPPTRNLRLRARPSPR